MGSTITGTVDDASNPTPECGNDKNVTPASESNPHEWLYAAAYRLLGPDAGWHLSEITDYPQSSCYAYVAHNPERRRRQPDHFTRTLLHSEDGADFHSAYMAGCVAVWWTQMQADAELGRKVRELK